MHASKHFVENPIDQERARGEELTGTCEKKRTNPQKSRIKPRDLRTRGKRWGTVIEMKEDLHDRAPLRQEILMKRSRVTRLVLSGDACNTAGIPGGKTYTRYLQTKRNTHSRHSGTARVTRTGHRLKTSAKARDKPIFSADPCTGGRQSGKIQTCGETRRDFRRPEVRYAKTRGRQTMNRNKKKGQETKIERSRSRDLPLPGLWQDEKKQAGDADRENLALLCLTSLFWHK